MEVEYLPEAIDSVEGIAALIATSRNGLRALSHSPYLRDALAIPLFVVGRSTLEEARAPRLRADRGRTGLGERLCRGYRRHPRPGRWVDPAPRRRR